VYKIIIMSEGVQFIEPSELFNKLNQVYLGSPCVTNDHYLLLFDARKSNEYKEDHVVTSCHVAYKDNEGFMFPTNIDYSAVKNIVIIDNRATSIKEVASPAVICANLLWSTGSKYPVKIVKGGYEEFSALYPFLRSQKVFFTKQELSHLKMYPIEIEPGFLYVGTYSQACDDVIAKHLKIKAHVNTTKRADPRYCDDNNNRIVGKNKELLSQLLDINIEDDVSCDIFSHFATACSFIEQHSVKDGKSLLIYSDLGSSRSASIALAYLIRKHKISLAVALKQIKKCHFSVCPNESFIKSLLCWETEVLGKQETVLNELGYLSYE